MEMEDRICPLRLQAFETNTTASYDTKLELCKCIKHKCAWYYGGNCAIVSCISLKF